MRTANDGAIGRGVAGYGLSQGDNFTKHPRPRPSASSPWGRLSCPVRMKSWSDLGGSSPWRFSAMEADDGPFG
jgi:hypothetical protein